MAESRMAKEQAVTAEIQDRPQINENSRVLVKEKGVEAELVRRLTEKKEVLQASRSARKAIESVTLVCTICDIFRLFSQRSARDRRK